ncbi:MAG: D-hexose-6-phosphate mutarotase [Marinobacter sp.]|uniref:D-hexose-6-phosphate mutarotase n=1 Tax=Marinobacter sp. TaxID=50741 RepID=UPI00349FF232
MTTAPGHWSFTRWITIGQLEGLQIHHPLFSAKMFLQGAHLTHYSPSGQANWLWMSETARFETGRAVRGGIPVCWPWFGNPEKNPPEVRKRILTENAHGFARTAVWKLEDIRESAQEVEVSLSLDANEDFSELWEGRCRALLTFSFSSRGLQLALTTTNAGREPLALTQALHTYLPTADISETRIRGLNKTSYIDTLDNWSTHLQNGPVRFSGETDRIYESGETLRIATPGGIRKLSSSGSDSTVVWNPGPVKAARLSDFPAEGWKSMLCVETANAANDYQVLNEGHSYTLAMMLTRC